MARNALPRSPRSGARGQSWGPTSILISSPPHPTLLCASWPLSPGFGGRQNTNKNKKKSRSVCFAPDTEG